METKKITREQLAAVADKLVNGWDAKPTHIPKDSNAFRNDIAVFEGMGQWGEPIRDITEIQAVTIETEELYQSAAIAKREH